MGIEIYPNGVFRVLETIDKMQIQNLYVLQKDAIPILHNSLKDNLIDEVQILFPDPWPKKRHSKRRLLSYEFLEIIVGKIKHDGLLNIATDWQDYADEILDRLRRIEKLGRVKNIYESYAPVAQLGRKRTKFEEQGINMGREIYELLFRVIRE